MPGRCLFFGDVESDYRAAQACGVHFLGILPDQQAPLLKSAPEVGQGFYRGGAGVRLMSMIPHRLGWTLFH